MRLAMRLWHLSARDNEDVDDEELVELVVRAETADDARQVAFLAAGMAFPGHVYPPCFRWLDPDRTDCVELTPDGEPGAIMTASVPR